MMMNVDLGISRRVTVITVTYNSEHVLPNMLNSLPDGVRCIIVDNASNELNYLFSLEGKSNVHLIKNTENMGFGRACNIGAALAQTEFLLFLNPDARLEDGALSALAKAADQNPRSVAFNPTISKTDGKLFFRRRSVLLRKSEIMPPGLPAEDCFVPILSGAAFFVRRKAFESVGGFDPNIFLYHEDDDLSLRLRAFEGSLMFVKNAHVMHASGQSTKPTNHSEAFKAFHMGRSRAYVMLKHEIPYSKVKLLVSACLKYLTPKCVLSAQKRKLQNAYMHGLFNFYRK